MPQVGIYTCEEHIMQNIILQEVNVNANDDDVIGSDETNQNREKNFLNTQLVLKDTLNRSSSLTDENKNDDCANSDNKDSNEDNTNQNISKELKPNDLNDKKKPSKKATSRTNTEIKQPYRSSKNVYILILKINFFVFN